jgi:haloalkane dehalogenase
MIESNFIDINNAQMHYVVSGQGDPIVLLHGIPTSSYLWRNIIPALSDYGQCIAPDLIGMGESAKPDIEYSVFQHIDYIEKLILELDLRDITFVLHGWGSVVGFDIASRHPGRVKALAFYESHLRSATEWDMLSMPVQQFATGLENIDQCKKAVLNQNFFIETMLKTALMGDLSEKAIEVYSKPFQSPESRRPLWQYVLDLPLGEQDGEVIKLIDRYSTWLQKTDLPKLMLYAMPGFSTPISTVQWAKDHFSNLTLVCLDDVMHFAQESAPQLFVNSLIDWFGLTRK